MIPAFKLLRSRLVRGHSLHNAIYILFALITNRDLILTAPRPRRANPPGLTQYLGHDIAIDVGQAKVPAGVSIHQPGMIDTHEMQDRRVVIVDVNGIFRRC